jgi:hypothetical protein
VKKIYANARDKHRHHASAARRRNRLYLEAVRASTVCAGCGAQTATSALVGDHHLAHRQRIADYVERQADLAFGSWRCFKESYPGPEWSHIADPLYLAWQELEDALFLVRCAL